MPTKSGSITGPVQALINEFSKLPTVGQKTAARLVFHLLNRPRNEAQSLAEAILAVKDKVRFCSVCFSLTEDDPCDICTDEEILAAQKMLASKEGVFCEPASAISIAGLLKDLERGRIRTGATVVCTLTGHGLKDPDTAIGQSSKPVTVDATRDQIERVIRDNLKD